MKLFSWNLFQEPSDSSKKPFNTIDVTGQFEFFHKREQICKNVYFHRILTPARHRGTNPRIFEDSVYKIRNREPAWWAEGGVRWRYNDMTLWMMR